MYYMYEYNIYVFIEISKHAYMSRYIPTNTFVLNPIEMMMTRVAAIRRVPRVALNMADDEFKAQNFALSGLLGGVGTDSFEDVISDVDGIFINMDVSTTTGFESGIDNVFLTAVPEPSSFTMIGIGATVLILYRRRMRLRAA